MNKIFNGKNLIILIQSGLLIFSFALFWRATGYGQNLACFFEKQKCLLVDIEKFTVIKKEATNIGVQELEADNLTLGNSSQVDLTIDLDKTPPEISWPKEYSLRSIKLEDVGWGVFSDDNRVVAEQSFENKSTVNYFALGQITEGDKLNPDKFPPLEKTGLRRYSVTLTLEKDNKIFHGVYGFIY